MIYKDKAFGAPDESFAFWNANKEHLGRVVEAVMSPEERFSLKVKDDDETEVWLSGCSTGSHSCWVTMSVLRDCGFNEEDIKGAVEADWFTLSR